MENNSSGVGPHHRGGAGGHPGRRLPARGGVHRDTSPILNDEAHSPYQRPPLSKDYLGTRFRRRTVAVARPRLLRGQGHHDAGGSRGFHRHRGAHRGTFRRHVPGLHPPGALPRAPPTGRCPARVPTLTGVHALRTLTDAQRLQDSLSTARKVVVIGAGFIGLEFAAGARARGLEVTVLEFAPRPMGRALSATASDWFTARHTADGIDLRLNEGVAAIHRDGDGLSVESTAGTRHPADLVLYGVGVNPRTELAQAAGLEVAERDRGRCRAADLGSRGVGRRRLRVLPPSGFGRAHAPGIGAERHRPGPPCGPQHHGRRIRLRPDPVVLEHPGCHQAADRRRFGARGRTGAAWGSRLPGSSPSRCCATGCLPPWSR